MILHSLDNKKCNGDVVVTDENGNIVFERPTMKCCHCGDMWVFIPGSKRKRGRCTRCSAFTCGSLACDTCIPLE